MKLQGTLNRTCENIHCQTNSKCIFGFLINGKRKVYLCEDCYKINKGLMKE